jgi:hypothetical protein
MSHRSLEVLFTKTDVTQKPGLARGPVAYILRLSIPLLKEQELIIKPNKVN